jgi:hypothetical protein
VRIRVPAAKQAKILSSEVTWLVTCAATALESAAAPWPRVTTPEASWLATVVASPPPVLLPQATTLPSDLSTAKVSELVQLRPSKPRKTGGPDG